MIQALSKDKAFVKGFSRGVGIILAAFVVTQIVGGLYDLGR